eukprot:1253761-Rhodomonas_salina.3
MRERRERRERARERPGRLYQGGARETGSLAASYTAGSPGHVTRCLSTSTAHPVTSHPISEPVPYSQSGVTPNLSTAQPDRLVTSHPV